MEEIVNINLTELEIERLYNCKLEGDLEKVRDIFVFGCYVAQRHSDYSRISYKDIKDNYITILQKKTGNRIRIPLHPIAKKILDKYNGELPKINLQDLNESLKHIAKRSKITDKILIRETKGGKRVEKYYEKWELITSHTARKSGVTNALRAGVPMEDCMYLAGIKSPAVFKKYAGVTDDEYSERLANTKYFSGDAETEELIKFAAKIIRSGENPYWLERLKGAYSRYKKNV
jgi:integrase